MTQLATKAPAKRRRPFMPPAFSPARTRTGAREQLLDRIEQHRANYYRFALWMTGERPRAAYLFAAVVMRVCAEGRRNMTDAQLRTAMFRALLEASLPYASPKSDPTSQLPAAEISAASDEQMHTLLAALTPTQRACYLLKRLERFTNPEIAEITQQPPETVTQHLTQARLTLHTATRTS